MFFKNLRFLIFIFLFGFLYLLPENHLTSTVSEIKYELIDQSFKESFFLEQITFETDFFFQKSEFLYLTGLKEGQQVSAQNLKNAFFYLKQKNRFEDILLFVEDGKLGKILRFVLKSFYVFDRLKIKGLFFGKDQYIQLYSMEHNDKFEQEKHERSIDSIKKKFTKQGYFNVNIKSTFKKDNLNKSILVYLKINKGKKFIIDNVKFKIADSFLSQFESYKFYDELNKNFSKKLSKKKFSSYLIKEQRRKIENYIQKKGFCFFDIKIQKIINYIKNTVDLEIKILLKKNRTLKFIGNQYFSESKLLDFIINQGQFIGELPSSILAQKLSEIYKEKGFWEVLINIFEENGSYIFKICEGPRATIEKLIISGCDFLYQKSIINKFFKHFLNSKYIDENKLSKSIDNLTTFYLKSGFWDIKIEKKITKNQNGKYKVEIEIQEGKRKFLKSVKIENFPQLESEPIFVPFKNLKSAIPFDINILNEHHKWLINYMKKMGYKNVVIRPDFVADENLEISLIWKINFEETSVNFGKTIIQGSNSKVSFERILRELKFSEGDSWSREKLEDTYLNLNQLKIFDSIQLYPSNTVDHNNNKPAILKLFPDDPIEVRTRIGFEQVNKNLLFKGLGTYKVGGTLICKNPFSLCDFFKLDAEFTRFEELFVAKYQIPWILGFPINTFFQLYFHKYDVPLYIGSDKIIYKFSDAGLLTGIAKKFKKIDYGFNLGINGIKITDLSIERAKAIDFSPSLLCKRVPYIFFEPNLMIDNLDDKLYPSRGSLTAFSFKSIFSLQNSNDYFLKFLFEHSFFKSIFESIVLAMRLRFGHIFVNNFSHLMPPLRFYLGGANTVRSFEPDLAPPLGIYIKDNNEIQRVPQGGKTLFNANFELRISTWKNLYVVLFQDIGFLIGKENKLDRNKLLTATGFGFRYATPIGPLRFDIGWRPKKYPEDYSFMWFITLGQAF